MKFPQARPGLMRIKPHMNAMHQEPRPDVKINISSNENALGPSNSVLAAARFAAMSMERYAEGAELQLSKAIAKAYRLNAESVVCGHGSDDLLARIARTYLQPGDELICSLNGYQKFPNYAYANDATAIRAKDREFTAVVDEILRCVTERTRIVMLANPDNPSGTWLSSTEVRRLITNLPSDVLLVLDSAYFEYVTSPDFEDPKYFVEEFFNVVMTRTFSKIYGLAGLRLGWLYAHSEIADLIRRIGTTFPISNIAFECGKAAIKDTQDRQFVRTYNLEVRDKFAESLANLGLQVYPSQTNFILVGFDTSPLSADCVFNELLKRGILARTFVAPSLSNCVRFTIGLESDMLQVERAMKEILSKCN